MRIDEIKSDPKHIIMQQCGMFEKELNNPAHGFENDWEVEVVQRTADSVVVKAYWADENGSQQSIRVVKKLAYKYFVDSDIDINYNIGVIDEQEHHSLYQLVLGW